MSNFSQPHGLQHTRLPCPSLSPGVAQTDMSIESVMPSDHLILCHPLLLLPSIFPSIRVSSNDLALCIRWPKYWSFSFSISPSNEYLGLKLITLSLLTSTLSLLLIYYLSSACSVPRIEQISYITSNLQTTLWSVYYDPCFM